MQQMGNLDYFYTLAELARAEGSRLEQFYELSPGFFRFKFGCGNLLAEQGVRCHFSKIFPESPQQPSSFAMFVRKHYCGKKLVSVRQLDFDRLLQLDFGDASMVIELFKSGNLLALDTEGIIVLPYRSEEFSSRKLRRGEAYSPPPQAQKHPSQASAEDVQGAAKVVAALSKRVSLPPFYLEEACSRAGVPLEAKADELGEKQKRALASAIRSLLEQPFSPRVYFWNGMPLAFSPFELKKLEGREFKVFGSFGEALDAYYAAAPRKAETKADKSGVVLQAQKEAEKKFSEKAADARQKAEWLTANAALVDDLLAAVRDADALKRKAAASRIKASLEKGKLVLDF